MTTAREAMSWARLWIAAELWRKLEACPQAEIDRRVASHPIVMRLDDALTRCNERDAEVARLTEEAERLRNLLATYIEVVPAFRSKPIGDEGSEAREQQRAHIALEDTVRAAIQKTKPSRRVSIGAPYCSHGIPLGQPCEFCLA